MCPLLIIAKQHFVILQLVLNGSISHIIKQWTKKQASKLLTSKKVKESCVSSRPPFGKLVKKPPRLKTIISLFDKIQTLILVSYRNRLFNMVISVRF